MPNLKAIACNYDYIRGSDVEEALGYSGHYSDVVYSRENYPPKGLAFISVDEESLTHVAAYKKSGRVATKLDRISIYKPITIDPSISLSEIENSLSNNIKHHFRKQTGNGISTISPRVSESIISYIQRTQPVLAQQITQLQREISGTPTNYHGHSAEIVAHEKDAVSFSLRVAGFSEGNLPSWNQEGEKAPFLTGYGDVVIREDPMVAHDAQVFGDWTKIRQYVIGAAQFERSGHKLTIMNVNRHKIEETLGVDLLVYHHAFRSYALIQYKRMVKDGETLVYRPTDRSYTDEINRMEEFQRLNTITSNLQLVDYRLCPEFFYFKLCPAIIKEPLSTQMIPGMYLPLQYWNLLMVSDSTIGAKGGRKISYENNTRYINNTLFVELMQNGWIGSQVSNTDAITEQIRISLDAGNSVLTANYERTNST